MSGVAESLAQSVVRGLEMLGNVANRLLRWGRPVIVPSGGNRIESGEEPAAKEVGEPRELNAGRGGRLARRLRLGCDGGGEQECHKDREATAHVILEGSRDERITRAAVRRSRAGITALAVSTRQMIDPA
jgi:hypothetical protein